VYLQHLADFEYFQLIGFCKLIFEKTRINLNDIHNCINKMEVAEQANKIYECNAKI